MKTKTLRVKEAAGMNPKMTVPPKPKKKKPPSPYKAPTTVRNYYKGIGDGINLLADSLCDYLEDKPFVSQEEMIRLIRERARSMKQSQSLKLSILEKEKTKQKIKKWEEDEWESI